MVSSSPQLAPDKLSGAAAGSRRAARRARELRARGGREDSEGVGGGVRYSSHMSSVGSWPVSAIQHRIASYAK